jgi:hypothetical protein
MGRLWGVVSVELLQSLGVVHRASIVAQMLIVARSGSNDKVLAFIKDLTGEHMRNFYGVKIAWYQSVGRP